MKDEIRTSGSIFTGPELREPTGFPQPQPPKYERRSTVTRTLLGGFLLGPVGALAGFAWKKRKPV